MYAMPSRTESRCSGVRSRLIWGHILRASYDSTNAVRACNVRIIMRSVCLSHEQSSQNRATCAHKMKIEFRRMEANANPSIIQASVPCCLLAHTHTNTLTHGLAHTRNPFQKHISMLKRVLESARTPSIHTQRPKTVCMSTRLLLSPMWLTYDRNWRRVNYKRTNNRMPSHTFEYKLGHICAIRMCVLGKWQCRG